MPRIPWRIATNHNYSTVCNTPVKVLRGREDIKKDSHHLIRVYPRRTYFAHPHAFISCAFLRLQLTTIEVVAHTTRWYSWYTCNETRIRATYLSMAMENGREDWSLGNRDWFFHRDFYLDIVCSNFLAAFAPIRRFGLLSVNGDSTEILG